MGRNQAMAYLITITLFCFTLTGIYVDYHARSQVLDLVDTGITIAKFAVVSFFLVAIVSVIVAGFFWGAITREKFLILQAERRTKERDAIVMIAPQGSLVRDASPEYWFSISRQEPMMLPAPQEDDIPYLIDEMMRMDRIFLQGGTDAGKTNVVKFYISELARRGANLTVIDPHSPSKILGIDCVGAGLNFDQIQDYFLYIMATITKRYKDGNISQDGNLGNLNHYLVIDEYKDITNNIGKDLAGDFLRCLLVRGRKAGYKYCILSQNRTIRSLGLEGDSHLLEDGCERVFIKKLRSNQRKAFIGWKKDDLIECRVPGEFIGYPQQVNLVNEQVSYSQQERDILRFLINNPDASKSEVYQELELVKNGLLSKRIDELRL